jgi:Holliday junction resolvase
VRRAAKIDANQTAIVEALRDRGAFVQSLAAVGRGCPDLLVGMRSRTILMEIKSRKSATLTKDQIEWANCWNGGPLWVVYTVEQALEILEQMG